MEVSSFVAVLASFSLAAEVEVEEEGPFLLNLRDRFSPPLDLA